MFSCTKEVALLQQYVKKKGPRRFGDSDEMKETKTKMGQMVDIEWGWLGYENRAKRDSKFTVWDVLISGMVVLQATLISFAAAFDPYNMSLLIVTYALDFINLIDICMTAWRHYEHDLRNTELRRGRCRLDLYFRGRFLIDFLGIAPVEMICYLYLKSNVSVNRFQIMSLLAYARTNRMLCLYKVFRYLRYLESHVGANLSLYRSLTYTVLSWLILHISACLWYLIPCHTWSNIRDGMRLCSAPSWIYGGYYIEANIMGSWPKPDQAFSLYNLTLFESSWNIYNGSFDHGLGKGYRPIQDWVVINATTAQVYMYSLYFTISTATTVGLGDVHGVTVGEQLFSLFVQMEGTLVIFGMIQGGITSMLTNFDVNQFRFKMRVSAITHYLRDQNQPSELVRDVLCFYRYLWERSRGMLSAGLFDQLPFALRSEISMELTGQIFDKAPLFMNIDASFLRMLSLKFRPMLALPDQILMEQGELCDMMVYVQKGELEVLTDDDMQVPLMMLRSGKLIGEINLITRMPRKYSIRAIGHCDLVVLRTEDLMECLQSYPEVADELRRRAEERAGVTPSSDTHEGILASNDTHESARLKEHEANLLVRIREEEDKMGANMRPLMAAFKIRRPQEQINVSESMELYRIRDPMCELVAYHTSELSDQIKSTYRSILQQYRDFSLDPDGLFYYFWERFIVLLVVVTFFINTYIAWFESYYKLLQDSIIGYLLLTVSYTMDVFLLLDFGLQFFVQISTPNGKICSHKKMREAYMMSWRFWCDMCAVLPLEFFLVFLISNNGTVFYVVQGTPLEADDFFLYQMQWMGFLKLNRCLKIFVLPGFFDRWTDELTASTAVVRLVKFTIYILISLQLGATLLIAFTCGAPDACPTDANYFWTASNKTPNITVDSANSYWYTTALYYAGVLLTTTGYGDIYPHNHVEQMVANLVMILGVLVYGYCIAVLTATLANLDGPRVEFQDRLAALNTFMEYNRMTDSVKNRAVDSVALLWTATRGEDLPGVKSMTFDLPDYLSQMIQFEDLMHLVASVPIFKNIEEDILKRFASTIRRYLFPPDEYIIQKGDLIHELFVIRRGVCQLYHPNDSSLVIGELQPGMYFGEIGFLFNHSEVVSVKTVTHCEVLTIPRPEFDQSVAGVRWFSHQMQMIAQNLRYYDDIIATARSARPVIKKRREESLIRLTPHEKRRLTFRDDFQSLSVNKLISHLYKNLMNYTLAINGSFLQWWTYSRVVMSTIIFVLTMIQVTYRLTSGFYFAICYLLDIYAWVDIYLQFHVQYYNHLNILVTHPYMTAKRYLRSNFWIDLLSVIPLEFFLIFTPGATASTHLRDDLLHMIMYMRLNRCFQIYRVPLAFNFLESDIKNRESFMFILKFINYFIILIAFATAMPLTMECGTTAATCGVNISACTDQVSFASPRTCVDTSYLTTVTPNITSKDSTWTQFVGGFYWAVTTLCIVGYGDITAQTNNGPEQILFLFLMIAGYVFFGYIIASIAAAQANSDARRSRFFDRLVAIKQYMNHEHVPKPLRSRITHYYQFLWLRTQGVDPKTLIVGLPPSLTAELALQLYRKVIEQVPIFKNTPIAFKKMMAAIVQPLYIKEGEHVIKLDDTGSELYFVYRGSIEVQFCNGVTSPQLVRAGRVLGEVAFFMKETSRISCQARENSDLYYATRKDFDLILEHYPEVREMLMEQVTSSMDMDAEFKTNAIWRKTPIDDPTGYKGYRHSLVAKRRNKMPLGRRLRLISRYIFPPYDRNMRYFSKYFCNFLRVISVMLMSYQPSFGHYTDAFYVVHYILEFVFIIDIVMKTRTGYLDEYGNQVLAKTRVLNRYLKSTDGLFMDLLNCFPYEVLTLVAPAAIRPKVWGYLRLLRIPTRLLRIFQLFNKWLAELDINVLFVRLLFTLTQLFLWLHFFACIGYFIACPDSKCDSKHSWISRTSLRNELHSEPQAYIMTIYWIVTTATTTGYGDILPLTDLERFFTCVVQVIGKFLFGIIVGDIASTLANLEISRQNFESKFQALRTYLLDQQANKSIIDRVRNYFHHLWRMDRGVGDIHSVLNDAPFCLRTELSYVVHQKDLRELPLFRDSSNAFVRMLSALLHQVHFIPGDYIIQQGDLVEEMYFLHNGEAVEVDNGMETRVIRRGSNINWQAILIDWPASRTVRATDNCEVYVLTRAQLVEVVSKYQDEMEHVCMTNRIRLRDLLEEEKVELD
ncbi:putative Cyclic nucleotide-gated cation channel subunit A [Hypsibius exemplaris]|uniref:Cyclic nucleotide-gated cation channel subunit A n=1 Tax=Hypsibius exemplaris TaxID=2072580 RepID=A0A1W0WFE9_HYPEX|nr:putative Cyclic nucleotide-gated cation channel subunit A [Hypsibius exemplaris]